MLAAAAAAMIAPVWAPRSARAQAASNGSGGDFGVFPSESITVGGRRRSFRLVVPGTTALNQPTPIVFAYHGLGDSKDRMAAYSRLDQLAEEHAFILVYPNAQMAFWPIVPQLAAPDLDFFDALVDGVGARYNIDLGRVYLVGNSNGAYFAHLIAAMRSERVTAIACHSGGMGVVAKMQSMIRRAYPVMLIHGDQDKVVPVGESRFAREMYERWGHAVEYLEVPGLAHLWANHIEVNEKIWAFFAKYSLGTRGRSLAAMPILPR